MKTLPRARELKLFFVALLVSFIAPAWADSPLPTSVAVPTTITSDVMELRNHGAETIFEGHVVLIQAPYRVVAHRMVQERSTGVVDLYKNVVGTWHSDQGDRVESIGDRARYTPDTQVLELWGNPKLTRWENEKDPMPMVVTADRFVADDPQKTVWAHDHVHIVQGVRLDAHAQEARYRTADQILDLGGTQPGQVLIHINDGRGSGDFISDKGWMSLDPRHARLIDHVKGHVIPAPK